MQFWMSDLKPISQFLPIKYLFVHAFHTFLSHYFFLIILYFLFKFMTYIQSQFFLTGVAPTVLNSWTHRFFSELDIPTCIDQSTTHRSSSCQLAISHFMTNLKRKTAILMFFSHSSIIVEKCTVFLFILLLLLLFLHPPYQLQTAF